MSKETEFIDWSGGECPVDKDTIVNVRLWSGDVIVNRKAGEFDWQHNSFGGDIIAYRVAQEKGKQMSGENDFIIWQGGERPVPPETMVEILLRVGGRTSVKHHAGDVTWHKTGLGGDIIAYRVVEEEKPRVEIPEGFTPWTGGGCPVEVATLAQVCTTNVVTMPQEAGSFDWRNHEYGGRILAYRVVIPDGFTPWAGGHCPVDLDTRVQLMLRNGDKPSSAASDCRWLHCGDGEDIIAYRVVDGKEKPKVEIPEGFTPWAGGACPVDAKARVDVVLTDGTSGSSDACDFDWAHVEGRKVNIIAYRVVEEEKSPSARDTQIGGDHYKTAAVQPWDVVDTWPIEQQVGFHRGNVLKYVMRMGTKDENAKEIKKAAHYLQKLAEVLEEKGGA